MDICDVYNLVVSPAEEPVSLAEAKLFLRIDPSFVVEDELITELIEAAREYAESYTNRDFVLRDWEGLFPGLQVSKFEPAPFIELGRSPLNSIDSVFLYTASGFVETTDYEIKQYSSYSRILFFNPVYSFPENTVYQVKVLFKAGYGNAGSVPKALKLGIKEHVNFLYENRGDVRAIGAETVPLQIKARYKKFRIINQF